MPKKPINTHSIIQKKENGKPSIMGVAEAPIKA